jgi:hypothetical protein
VSRLLEILSLSETPGKPSANPLTIPMSRPRPVESVTKSPAKAGPSKIRFQVKPPANGAGRAAPSQRIPGQPGTVDITKLPSLVASKDGLLDQETQPEEESSDSSIEWSDYDSDEDVYTYNELIPDEVRIKRKQTIVVLCVLRFISRRPPYSMPSQDTKCST